MFEVIHEIISNEGNDSKAEVVMGRNLSEAEAMTAVGQCLTNTSPYYSTVSIVVRPMS